MLFATTAGSAGPLNFPNQAKNFRRPQLTGGSPTECAAAKFKVHQLGPALPPYRMEHPNSTERLFFQGFRLDRRGLFRVDGADETEPVALSSRALDLLRLLAERQGELLPKDLIMEAVWPGTAVAESNLTVQMSALRRVLDHERAQGSCIQTIPGRGYRFVVPVTQCESPPPTPTTQLFADGGDTERQQELDLTATPGEERPAAVPARFPWPLVGIFGAAILALSLVVTAWNWHSLWPGRASSTPPLSIVVLPFGSLSADPDQQYFAEAITEDLTTDLSRLSDSLVISASTARSYGDRPADVKRIGRELDVHYVLEGSIERSGGRVRINAQLINAKTDAHLWAERFDRDAGDLFALEDEIAGRIANALSVVLVRAEADRPAETLDALDYIFRGRALLWQPQSRDTYAEAVSLFERALAIDPRSVEAQSFLATSLTSRVLAGMSDSRADDLSRAEGLIGQAVSVAPASGFAHFAKGQLLRAQHRCAAAIREFEAVLAVNRNSAAAIARVGYCKLRIGSPEEAISVIEKAIRISPRDPQLGVWYFWIGQAYLLQSRVGDAVASLEKASSTVTGLWFVHEWLAAADALNGDGARAAAELAESRRLSEHNWPSSVAQQRASYGAENFETPAIRAALDTTYLAGLREAGVPEE
jgi:TolB-like protein/DNA-binding winged helix-turn-helix (wHTH) protein/cytochrome c-type biogenesis protein CcmH/NrfG